MKSKELRGKCILLENAYVSALVEYAENFTLKLGEINPQECPQIINDLSKAIYCTSKENTYSLHTTLAAGKLNLENFEEAIEYCNLALEINPNSYKALAIRGRAKLDISDLEGAMTDSHNAIKIFGEDTYPYCTLASVAIKKKKLDIAYQMLHKALKIDAKDFNIYQTFAFLYLVKNELEDVIEYANKAIEFNNQLTSLSYCYRGRARYLQNDLKSAREDFLEAMKLNPYIVFPYVGLSWISIENQNYQAAIAYTDEIFKKDPTNPYAYEILARAKFFIQNSNGGDLKEVYEICDQAIQLKPDSSNAYTTRARINLAEQRFSDAIENCKKAIELNSQNIHAYVIYGAINEAIPNYQEALCTYQKLIQFLNKDEAFKEMISSEIKRIEKLIQQSSNNLSETNGDNKRECTAELEGHIDKKSRSEEDSLSFVMNKNDIILPPDREESHIQLRSPF